MTILRTEAQRRKRPLRLRLIALSIVSFFFLGMFLMLRATTEILVSDVQISVIVPAAMGLLAWLPCLFVVLDMKPRTWKKIVAALIFPLLAALIAMTATMLALERLQERAEFSHGPLRQKVADLAIEEAFYSRGNLRRSPRYTIALRDYPVQLPVDEADYLVAFGRRGQVHPYGRCIRVTVQKSAHALRLVGLDHGALPRGSLVRCSTTAAPPL